MTAPKVAEPKMSSASVGTGDHILEVTNLSVCFDLSGPRWLGRRRRVIRAVDNQSFHIVRGETLGLVGESGCGKSTTGRALVRLNQPAEGTSIRFNDRELIGLGREELRQVRRRIQMVFQDPYSSLNPRMTVREIIGEPLEVHGFGSRKEIYNRLLELVSLVRLPETALNRYPNQFSGGQRQRIGIARALALHPELIVADEPVSALDVSIQAQIINLLIRLQRTLGLTYLFISHDLAVVRQICDRVMVMFFGRVVESAPVAELFLNPLHPYSVALLSAVPIPDPKLEAKRKRIILRGDVSTLEGTLTGCRFRSRCWLYNKLGSPGLCDETEPASGEASPGHLVECHFRDRITEFDEQKQVIGLTA
jgi:oligopeptide transport system ATP-binding protein